MSAGSRHRRARLPGRWTLFVRRYGWRAYALPVLTFVTIAALMQGTATTGATASHQSAAGARPATSGIPREANIPSRPGTPAPSTGVRVEGASVGDAAFGAASTPAPVVVNLGDDAISCAANTDDQLVLVSITKQHLWACDGGKQVNSVAVTTGATVDHDQTPLGSWRVQAKQRDRYLVGPGYKDYVHYWVPFNGDFGLHDAPWQTMPFGSPGWPTRGSHGCVHLPTTTMAWLYKWARVGHTVVTIES